MSNLKAGITNTYNYGTGADGNYVQGVVKVIQYVEVSYVLASAIDGDTIEL